MDYREYGRTGKKVSAIGFGGLRFPKEDYQSGNYENSVKIIHRAHELGVNYFDTVFQKKIISQETMKTVSK